MARLRRSCAGLEVRPHLGSIPVRSSNPKSTLENQTLASVAFDSEIRSAPAPGPRRISESPNSLKFNPMNPTSGKAGIDRAPLAAALAGCLLAMAACGQKASVNQPPQPGDTAVATVD